MTFAELTSGKLLDIKVIGFWAWSLEMVQRCYIGIGDIHINRGS
jgi:hypothetical protein